MFKIKNKIVFTLLTMMTILAIVIIFLGIITIKDIDDSIRSSLLLTEKNNTNNDHQIYCAYTEAIPRFDEQPDNNQQDYESSENKPYGTNQNLEPEQTDILGIGILTIQTNKEYRCALFDGLTNESLRKGAARALGSALPGQSGNCLIFGHRDTVFKCLKNIKTDENITIQTKSNIYSYVVEKTFVCGPDSPEITRSYDGSYLTLVTCYPFVYSGAAPKRFIVICRLLN